jgi:single-strand DNA-binding protein
MSGETTVTVIGNLTSDPELRFTNVGSPVANFTVASTPRTFDRETGEWKDGDSFFIRCTIWRQAAENVAESLSKGMRVVVQGRLRQRAYDTKEGDKRVVVELEVDEIGASLKFATAEVTRPAKRDVGNGASSAVAWSGGYGRRSDELVDQLQR